MDLTIPTLAEARHNFLELSETLQALADTVNTNTEEPIDITIAAMNQFFDIAEGVDASKTEFVANDISDIGEQGLLLLEKLIFKAEALHDLTEKQQLEHIALAIADWIIQRDGSINLLEPIVDALAQLANVASDEDQLIDLAEFMGEIADACSDAIKQDLELSNMQRPWRILNINRGIVATRTNDPQTMRSVFSDLIKALPMDAPGFFKEGMSEMIRLDYPPHVRDVMQEYFDQTDLPQIH